MTYKDIINEEEVFRKAYTDYASKSGLNIDPDDPRHFYDYRGYYKKYKAFKPDAQGHLPSEFKLEGHPRMILEGVNTKTGKRL